MSAIVAFYRGEQPDYLGRRLEDVWAWDNDRLEMIHNYIQVLFPSDEPSLFNARAPLLDAETVAAFRGDERLRRNLAASHDRMLRFYGLAFEPQAGRVVRRPDFEARARNWVNPFNHNYLRITRILKCLMALGLETRARAFFGALEAIYDERPYEIGPETFDFWQNAVRAAPDDEEGTGLRLRVLGGAYAVCRLDPGAPAPAWGGTGLFALTRTADELSVVCPESDAPPGVRCERGWRCLQVIGPLDLAAVGVLASLVSPLAAADVSVFVLSTFDTDYLLVKDEAFEAAVEALGRSGHRVEDG